MEANVLDTPQLHVRWDGRSFDVDLNDLDVGTLSTDAQVREAMARHLGVPRVKLETFRIDRDPSGHMTMRPEAVFG